VAYCPALAASIKRRGAISDSP